MGERLDEPAAPVVMDLLIDPAQATLIAATHGRGAYTAQLSQAPPFARLTASGAITRPVSARFNVPVQNVTTTDFVVRVQGTTTNLPGTIACTDPSGAPVDCLTGPVSAADLQPTSPLVPGQRHVASIDPAGAPDQVTDGNGTPVLTTSLAFRASLREEETSAAAAYTWQTVTPGTTPGPLGGSYDQHHLLTATASFGFDGGQVTWITVDGPDQGIAQVFVDNVLVGTFDGFDPTPTYNVRHTFSGFSAGHHVIRIEPTGQANTSAKDAFVSIDGYQVGDTTPIATPRVTYGWQPDSAFDSRIGYVRSDLGATAIAKETTATFTFRGTAVTWRTIAGPDQGRAQVLIDGVNKGVVDNYKSTLGTRSVAFGGLADAVHTMKIVVLGTKAATSTGTFVAVDGWKVH